MRAELVALEKEIRGFLKPVAVVPYLVFHNAYRYFEKRFDLGHRHVRQVILDFLLRPERICLCQHLAGGQNSKEKKSAACLKCLEIFHCRYPP